MDERHRVLIADSYPDEAEQLKKELSGKYNVISVRDNGVDTLDDIIKLKPDLVVIDLMLSEIDGIGVIEKCRELIEPDKIPAFIALTMLENRELMECIRRLKVDYFMMKPFQACFFFFLRRSLALSPRPDCVFLIDTDIEARVYLRSAVKLPFRSQLLQRQDEK